MRAFATPQRLASLRALMRARRLDARERARCRDRREEARQGRQRPRRRVVLGHGRRQGRPLHRRARVDRDDLFEADGHLRRRDRLLGRSVDADVAIVGAGIAGALIASRLAAAGVKVVVLEAGPRVQRGDAVTQFMQRARSRCPSARIPTPRTRRTRAPTTSTATTCRPGRRNSRARTCARSAARRGTGSARACASCPTISGSRRRFGRGVDWPIDYATLEPWYAQAESEIGVAGDSAQDLGSPRSAAVSDARDPDDVSRQADGRRASRARRTRCGPRRRAATRSCATTARRAAATASCIPICPIQAKYDATVHVARAEAAGVRLMPQSVVSFVEVAHRRQHRGAALQASRRQRRAHHREDLRDRRARDRDAEAAPDVEAGARTERRGQRERPGRPQPHGSPDPALVRARRRRRCGPIAGRCRRRASRTRARATGARRGPSFRIEIGNDGWSWPTGAPIADAQELAAQGLARRGAAKGHPRSHVARDTLRHADRATARSREPHRARRRASAMRWACRARASPTASTTTRCAGLAEARRIHEDAFVRMKATEIHHNPDREFQGAGHVLGTTRMGTDARTAVVDARPARIRPPQPLHRRQRASSRPAARPIPTLTIAALALRVGGRDPQDSVTDRTSSARPDTAYCRSSRRCASSSTSCSSTWSDRSASSWSAKCASAGSRQGRAPSPRDIEEYVAHAGAGDPRDAPAGGVHAAGAGIAWHGTSNPGRGGPMLRKLSLTTQFALVFLIALGPRRRRVLAHPRPHLHQPAEEPGRDGRRQRRCLRQLGRAVRPRLGRATTTRATSGTCRCSRTRTRPARRPSSRPVNFYSKNPALAQREFSEVVEHSASPAKFRLTSHNVMNPNNKPDVFEDGRAEAHPRRASFPSTSS